MEHDTSLAAYLLRPDVRTLGLADVVQRHVGHELSDNATGTDRAQAVAELVKALTPEVEEAGQSELYFDLEVPLALILANSLLMLSKNSIARSHRELRSAAPIPMRALRSPRPLGSF